jgi:hypothetical protein
VLLKIRGGRADDPVVGGDFAGNERGILKLREADGEIEPLADDVDEPVGQAEVGRDMEAVEGRRHGDLQNTAQPGVAAAHEVLGLLAQAEDIDHALEVAGPGLGQHELAHRALEQARTEALLEMTDAFGYDRGDKPISRPAADMLPVRAPRANISKSLMAFT